MDKSGTKKESLVLSKLTNLSDDKCQKETYERFVQALENHGTSRKNAWDNISLDMGWPVKDVKAYAFSYMLKLHAVTSHERKGSDQNLLPRKVGYEEIFFSTLDRNDEGINAVWSYEECIFFDNLMARYFSKESDVCEVIDKIVELIPSKNKSDIRKRIISYSK